MNILISNDDGIQAQGIRELADALCKLGDVYIFAPDSQKSASSHALSISRPIKVEKTDFPNAKEAYKVDGTPADCVKLGLDLLHRKGISVDIIYSGINHGGNLGSDTMYSGTVSAAAEGAFEGLPSVAVSVNSHEPKHFEGCCKLAEEVLPFAVKTAGSRSVISINTPDIPIDEMKGVLPAKLGFVEYDQWFDVIDETEDSITYQYCGEPLEVESWEEDTDALLIRKEYATISMIKYDLNNYEGFEKLKKWELKLK